MAIIHLKLTLALKYMYELSSYAFSSFNNKKIRFLFTEGSKMVKSERKNTVTFKQSKIVCAVCL